MQAAPISFADLHVVSELEQTHQSAVRVCLADYKKKKVICKSISKAFINDSIKLQHLHNQKEALLHFTNLKSRHVNHVISTFKDQTDLHFLLEPVEGLPLHKLMKMMGKFPPKFVALIAQQVVWIMQEFHAEGYIYRDIKLSNYIVGRLGKVTMIDLGNAKRVNKERTLTICGTLHAIPPEVLFGGGSYPYSYEFDYYQFGVFLFEMLAGKPPFGYEGANVKIREDIAKGLSEEHLKAIEDAAAANLIKQLMFPPPTRLGGKGGWSQIMNHKYFSSLNTAELRTVYNGEANDELLDVWGFEPVRQEIEDFGLDVERYQVEDSDPFENF